MEFEILHTPRLMLRKVTPADISYVFENMPKAEICAFLGISTDAEYDNEYEKYRQGYTSYNRSALLFHLIEKTSQQIIGSCNFHNWYVAHKRAEVGYALNKEEHKGKGYMSEALEAVIRYGFTQMGLQRIEATIGPLNIPSQKLVRKNNFTQEGLLRKHYFRNGAFEDSLVFALLKEEYQGNP